MTHSAPHSPLPPHSAATELLSPIAALNSTHPYDALTQGLVGGTARGQGTGLVSARGAGAGIVSAKGPAPGLATTHAPSPTLNHSQRRSSVSHSLFSVSNRPFDPFSRVLPIFSISFTATKVNHSLVRNHSFHALGLGLGLGGEREKLSYEQQVMNGLMDDSRLTTAAGGDNTPVPSTALPDTTVAGGENNEENDLNDSIHNNSNHDGPGGTSTTTSSRTGSLHIPPTSSSRPNSKQNNRPSSQQNTPVFVPELMVVPTVITNLAMALSDHNHHANSQGLVAFYGMGGGMGVGHGPHDHHIHTHKHDIHKHGHKGGTKEDKEDKRSLHLTPANALSQVYMQPCSDINPSLLIALHTLLSPLNTPSHPFTPHSITHTHTYTLTHTHSCLHTLLYPRS